jgi:hypothetical protein
MSYCSKSLGILEYDFMVCNSVQSGGYPLRLLRSAFACIFMWKCKPSEKREISTRQQVLPAYRWSVIDLEDGGDKFLRNVYRLEDYQ